MGSIRGGRSPRVNTDQARRVGQQADRKPSLKGLIAKLDAFTKPGPGRSAWLSAAEVTTLATMVAKATPATAEQFRAHAKERMGDLTMQGEAIERFCALVGVDQAELARAKAPPAATDATTAADVVQPGLEKNATAVGSDEAMKNKLGAEDLRLHRDGPSDGMPTLAEVASSALSALLGGPDADAARGKMGEQLGRLIEGAATKLAAKIPGVGDVVAEKVKEGLPQQLGKAFVDALPRGADKTTRNEHVETGLDQAGAKGSDELKAATEQAKVDLDVPGWSPTTKAFVQLALAQGDAQRSMASLLPALTSDKPFANLAKQASDVLGKMAAVQMAQMSLSKALSEGVEPEAQKAAPVQTVTEPAREVAQALDDMGASRGADQIRSRADQAEAQPDDVSLRNQVVDASVHHTAKAASQELGRRKPDDQIGEEAKASIADGFAEAVKASVKMKRVGPGDDDKAAAVQADLVGAVEKAAVGVMVGDVTVDALMQTEKPDGIANLQADIGVLKDRTDIAAKQAAFEQARRARDQLRNALDGMAPTPEEAGNLARLESQMKGCALDLEAEMGKQHLIDHGEQVMKKGSCSVSDWQEHSEEWMRVADLQAEADLAYQAANAASPAPADAGYSGNDFASPDFARPDLSANDF